MNMNKMFGQGRLWLGIYILSINMLGLQALKFQNNFEPERHLYGKLGLIFKPRIQTVLLEKQSFRKIYQFNLPLGITLQTELQIGDISCERPIKYLYLNNLAYNHYMELENYKGQQMRINTERNNLQNIMHVKSHQIGSENVLSPLQPENGRWLDTLWREGIQRPGRLKIHGRLIEIYLEELGFDEVTFF